MPNQRAEVVAARDALERWGSSAGWIGSDPYDGLNATRLVKPLLHSILGRRVLTQLVKRSPVDLRTILGIRAGPSSAALAQVVSAYARDEALDPRGVKLESMLTRLDNLRCSDFVEPCWGYHFDVQTRVFFYPAGSPNTIATAFAGMALLDAYARTADPRWLQLAEGAGDFFLSHIPQTFAAQGSYFGYLVGDRTPIHNANMLVCALLSRLSAELARADFAAAAERGVAFTVNCQQEDGSWPYGERPHLSWIDNFHTGYVLESLLVCLNAGVAASGAQEALDRGLLFYQSELFTRDGVPKYLPTSLYPIDAQCVAQGIQTFALAGSQHPKWGRRAWEIAAFALKGMRRRDGAFVFQKRRLWTNRTPHVRWVEAPMLLALVSLLASTDT